MNEKKAKTIAKLFPVMLFACACQVMAQTPPPPVPPHPQGTLFTLPAGGWSISPSGDIWDTDGNDSLSVWSSTGGVSNLVSSSPVYGNLSLVNGGLGIYVREDSPFTPLLTAVNLSTGAIDQITVNSSSVGSGGGLAAESGHVFFLGQPDFSSSTKYIYDWLPGSNPAAGLVVEGSSGVTLAVSPDLQSTAVNGNWGFPPSGGQFHSTELGTLAFPDSDTFRQISFSGLNAIYENTQHEIKSWIPSNPEPFAVTSLGTIPDGWRALYIAGNFGVKIQNDDLGSVMWFKNATDIETPDVFFRGLLDFYGVDASGIPTIDGGNVAGETGEFVFSAGGQQYFVTTAVPEPSTIALLVFASSVGAFALRRASRSTRQS